MANIRIDLDCPIVNGQSLTFRSPADCSQITGLIVYYPDIDSTISQVFQFADAHGNNIGDLDLFASDSLVKIVLDTQSSLAFVQNADTNAYLETKFAELYNFVRSRREFFSVTLLADNWIGSTAPYTQTIAVRGIFESHTPHYGIVYSDDAETKLAEKEAYALVDDLETFDGSVMFTCLEDKPTINLVIQMEVHN